MYTKHDVLLCNFGFIFLFASSVLSFNTDDKYGPYSVEYTQLSSCGSPSTSASTAFFSVKLVKRTPPVAFTNLTLLTPLRIDELKFNFYSVKSGRRLPIINKVFVKPCNNYLALKCFQAMFNFTKTCILPKGSYVLTLNYFDLTKKVLGDQFYYGEYYVRSTLISNKKYVCCLIVNYILHPSKGK